MLVTIGCYLRRNGREQIMYPPKKETNLFLLVYNISYLLLAPLGALFFCQLRNSHKPFTGPKYISRACLM